MVQSQMIAATAVDAFFSCAVSTNYQHNYCDLTTTKPIVAMVLPRHATGAAAAERGIGIAQNPAHVPRCESRLLAARDKGSGQKDFDLSLQCNTLPCLSIMRGKVIIMRINKKRIKNIPS
jgi:hypothetical protein